MFDARLLGQNMQVHYEAIDAWRFRDTFQIAMPAFDAFDTDSEILRLAAAMHIIADLRWAHAYNMPVLLMVARSADADARRVDIQPWMGVDADFDKRGDFDSTTRLSLFRCSQFITVRDARGVESGESISHSFEEIFE